MRKFLKTNKKNIEMGKKIEFSDSKFYLEKITFSLFFLLMSISLIYFLYSVIFARNKIVILVALTILIGGTIGVFYRKFIKTSNKSLGYKKVTFLVAVVLAGLISIGVFRGKMFNISKWIEGVSNTNIEGYKVLSLDDFSDEGLEKDVDLMKKASILIPKSYEYTSFRKGDGYIRTEYADALTIDLAKNLVNRYIKQGENRIVGNAYQKLEHSFEKETYNPSLESHGLSEEEFNSLKSKDIKRAIEDSEDMVQNKSIVKDIENLWNLDEVYFLTYSKDEIIIRQGKEVFYLEGLDFSDPEVIKLAKEKLGL